MVSKTKGTTRSRAEKGQFSLPMISSRQLAGETPGRLLPKELVADFIQPSGSRVQLFVARYSGERNWYTERAVGGCPQEQRWCWGDAEDTIRRWIAAEEAWGSERLA